jgi:hypothetical protein
MKEHPQAIISRILYAKANSGNEDAQMFNRHSSHFELDV